MARHEGAGHNGTGGKANEPSKRERESLRRAMLNEGHSVEQIMVEMMQRWGTRRRKAWRHAHGWTLEEVAARYNQHVDDPQARMAYNRISDYEAWPDRATNRPSLTVLTNLAAIYGTVSSNLVDFYDLQHFPKTERAALLPQPEAPQTDAGPSSRHPVLPARWAPASENAQTRVPSISELIISAADKSLNHAENAQGQTMPETTLDEVTAEVERLTKEHLYTDPLVTFSDTVHTRDQIYRFLEQRQYPKQTQQLYYLASILCELLADTSENFGFRRAAMEQTRASWAYAEIIGHNSLRLKSRILQATLASRDSRPQRALKLAISATPWATEPIGKAHLYNVMALYSSMMAQHSESRTALAQALDAHESATGDSELFDHLGGMFSYSLPKLLQVATKTYLELGDIPGAENSAAEAIRLYESGPAEMRAFGNEACARIDLGRARLLRGDTEAAEEALRPVLGLPPSRRLDWVGQRLRGFHSTLRAHSAATSTLGRQLGQDIEEFFESPASAEFPSRNGY